MPSFRLFGWGANNYGQLANGQPCEQLERPIPIQAPVDDQSMIYLGGGHTFLVTGQNQIFASGWNNKGQCGVGSKANLSEFTPIANIKAVQIATGWDFSLVVSPEKRLYGCGSNAFGQLGLGGVKEVLEFEEIDLSDDGNGEGKVKKAVAGMRHSLILMEDGTIRVCGSGKKGQLCDSGLKSVATPIKVSFPQSVIDIKAGQNFSLLTFEDGSLQAFGDDKHGQISNLSRIPSTQIKQIEVGWTHIVTLLKNDTLMAVGRQDYGQTGVLCQQKFSSVSCGYEHGLATSLEGDLFAWGWNEHGNCGLGHVDNVHQPTKVDLDNRKIYRCFAGSGHSFAIVTVS